MLLQSCRHPECIPMSHLLIVVEAICSSYSSAHVSTMFHKCMLQNEVVVNEVSDKNILASIQAASDGCPNR